MARDLFRKSAIDRLSSPERLDTLTRVTTPRGWLALIAILLLIALAGMWAFTGSQSVTISGQGVLVRPGGIAAIGASVDGQVSDVRVQLNDHVERGNVIARVHQPELIAKLAELRRQQDTGDDGAALDEQVRQLELLIESRSRIVSPYSGRVIEVAVKKFDRLAQGVPVATIELDDASQHELQTVMYIPAQVGKKIMPGMEVRIDPTTVSKEEFGHMLGRVVSVSEYPATPQSMMNTLGNEAFVRQLSASGAALLEVRVQMLRDASTPSGYRWSTKEGPPVKIKSGTPMTGSIIVMKQKPIGNVLPFFR